MERNLLKLLFTLVTKFVLKNNTEMVSGMKRLIIARTMPKKVGTPNPLTLINGFPLSSGSHSKSAENGK